MIKSINCARKCSILIDQSITPLTIIYIGLRSESLSVLVTKEPLRWLNSWLNWCSCKRPWYCFPKRFFWNWRSAVISISCCRSLLSLWFSNLIWCVCFLRLSDACCRNFRAVCNQWTGLLDHPIGLLDSSLHITQLYGSKTYKRMAHGCTMKRV